MIFLSAVYYFATFISSVTSVSPISESTKSTELELRLDLLRRDLLVRPSSASQKSTLIQVGLWSTDGFLLNSKKETFTLTTIISIKWTNENAKWDTTKYINIDRIQLPAFYVWTPLLHLYNGVKSPYKLDTIELTRSSVSVTSDGDFELRIMTPLTTRCLVHLRNFPFDKHTCNVRFQNPPAALQTLALSPTALNFSIQSGEWQVQSGDTVATNSSVTFIFHLQRLGTIHLYILLSPIMVSVIASILAFHVPYASGEKVMLSSISTALQLVLLLQVTWMAPSNGSGIPLIVVLVGGCLAISCFALVISSILLSLSVNSRISIVRPLPKWLSHVLCLPQIPSMKVIAKYSVRNDNDDDLITINAVPQTTQYTVPLNLNWIQLCIALDRIFFLIFVTFYEILVLSLFL